MQTYTTDGKHGARITHNGNKQFIAIAIQPDNFGGSDFWFSVGNYTTLKGAQHGTVKQLARHGYVIGW